MPEAEINLPGRRGYNEKLCFYETITNLIIDRLRNELFPGVCHGKPLILFLGT